MNRAPGRRRATAGACDLSTRGFPYTVGARSGAVEDLVVVASDVQFVLQRLAIVRSTDAGTSVDVDLIGEGFAPQFGAITVVGASSPSTTDAAPRSTSRATTSRPPSWLGVPAEQLSAGDVQVIRSEANDGLDQFAAQEVRLAPGDVTLDLTMSPLSGVVLDVDGDTFSVVTTGFPAGVLEGELASFDTSTSTQVLQRVLVTPARRSDLVRFPSPTTVPGFADNASLGGGASGAIRVHSGADADVLIDLIVDGPQGHEGVATRSVGRALP